MFVRHWMRTHKVGVQFALLQTETGETHVPLLILVIFVVNAEANLLVLLAGIAPMCPRVRQHVNSQAHHAFLLPFSISYEGVAVISQSDAT